MERVYHLRDEVDEFSPAVEQFTILQARLRSEEAARMEHEEVEKLLKKDGTELLRRLLQGHLDVRAANETRAEAIQGADDTLRSHHRNSCERDLGTTFGTVKVNRLGYSARGTTSLFPMDAVLNLPLDKYSHGLRLRLAGEISKNSFDNAVVAIEETTGGNIPKRQAEQLAALISQDFEAFYQRRSLDELEQTKDLMILTMDNKGIVMRQQDLREGTRKQAEKQAGQRKARLGKGEKRNRKRMAAVASVYTIGKHHRTADEIMGSGQTDRTQPKPKPRNKRVWASVEREPERVAGEVFEEAIRRDPEQHREWVVLVDGEMRQIDRIVDQAAHHHVAVTVVLDFIHVLEYLWKAAYCFFVEGSQEAERWVRERARNILKGRASHVAAGIRRSATLRGLSAKKREAADKCANYLIKYQEALRYDEYLSQGYPIATGVIEGACRHLIKDRMDLTGARWRLKSAEAILKLRSLRSSNDFDEYWEFHKAEEFRRNHASRYADAPLRNAA
mgnify:CR=1 FL=1